MSQTIGTFSGMCGQGKSHGMMDSVFIESKTIPLFGSERKMHGHLIQNSSFPMSSYDLIV